MAWRCLIVLLALFALPTTVRGQVPVVDFDELKACLTVGKSVLVTDDREHVTEGKLVDLSALALVMETAGERKTIPVQSVRLVRKRQGDPLWDGALKGFVAGLPLALAFLNGNPESLLFNSRGYFAAGTLAISIGVGLIADALSDQKIVIYRAKAGPSLALAPILMPQGNGLRLWVSF